MQPEGPATRSPSYRVGGRLKTSAASRYFGENGDLSWRRSRSARAEFQDRVGEALDRSLSQPVLITKHGRPRNVVLSYDEYERLRAQGPPGGSGRGPHTDEDITALRSRRARWGRDTNISTPNSRRNDPRAEGIRLATLLWLSVGGRSSARRGGRIKEPALRAGRRDPTRMATRIEIAIVPAPVTHDPPADPQTAIGIPGRDQGSSGARRPALLDHLQRGERVRLAQGTGPARGRRPQTADHLVRPTAAKVSPRRRAKNFFGFAQGCRRPSARAANQVSSAAPSQSRPTDRHGVSSPDKAQSSPANQQRLDGADGASRSRLRTVSRPPASKAALQPRHLDQSGIGLAIPPSAQAKIRRGDRRAPDRPRSPRRSILSAAPRSLWRPPEFGRWGPGTPSGKTSRPPRRRGLRSSNRPAAPHRQN